jgi:hypothetical protein
MSGQWAFLLSVVLSSDVAGRYAINWYGKIYGLRLSVNNPIQLIFTPQTVAGTGVGPATITNGTGAIATIELTVDYARILNQV